MKVIVIGNPNLTYEQANKIANHIESYYASTMDIETHIEE